MVVATSLTHYLLLLLMALVGSSLQSDFLPTCRCKIERMSMNVSAGVPGCDDATIKVRICNGACTSAQLVRLEPPFVSAMCNSCQSSNYKIKPKRVKFICDGKPTKHRVYLPVVKECSCSACTTTYADSFV